MARIYAPLSLPTHFFIHVHYLIAMEGLMDEVWEGEDDEEYGESDDEEANARKQVRNARGFFKFFKRRKHS